MNRKLLQVIIILATFWGLDFIFHEIGVGETNYYFISKFVNGFLFAIIWVYVLNKDEAWKKLLYSFVFGSWVSLYYLASSYSGFVQFLGIDARYTPPPFVIFGIFLSPYLWWFFHGFVFYVGVQLSSLLNNKN